MPQFDYGNVNPFAAVQQGIDFSQGMQNAFAQRQAGNLLAQTADPASAALYKSGQLQQGAAVQDRLQGQQKQALAEHLAFLGKAADYLSTIPDDGTQAARKQALEPDRAAAPAIGLQARRTSQKLQQARTCPTARSACSGRQLSKLQFEKLGDDIVGLNPNTGAEVSRIKGAPAEPKPLAPHWVQEVHNGKLYWHNLNAPTPTASAVPPYSVPAASQGAGADFFKSFILPHEGGLNPADLNGSPTNYGFNQKANPDINVKDLTPDSAAQRFEQTYWAKSGAASLPPGLAQAHADTYFINPTKAQEFLQQSGGDPNKYMDLREQWLNGLASSNPAAQKYAKAWANRNADLRAVVQRAQGGSSQAGQASQSDVPPGLISAGDAKPSQSKWEILTDTKNGNKPYRYNAASGQATTLDGQAYTPVGAAKLGGGGAPRSAIALAVAKYVEQNPNATASDIANFNADYRKRSAAATAFGTGKQGQTVNSINVGVSHLNTMQEAADALNNGDIPLFNKVAKDWQTATGKAAPTNFDAIKQIVADEVVKAIVGSGAAAGDREKAQAILNRANSPDQLSGAITEIKKLMAGQLSGLRLQYKNSTGLDDFETHLFPETQAELESLPQAGSGGAAAPSPAAAPGAKPPAGGGGNPGQGWGKAVLVKR
jgi:hypothetical protein